MPRRIGKYELERRLGGGGMAEVYLARAVGAEGFARRVAIKRVLPAHAEHPILASMFVREARLSARLHHPNVVSVLDFDRDPRHGLFLVMEWIEGLDLCQLLRTGVLPIPVTIQVISELLRGLGYVHKLPLAAPGACGLVHRDVSPHNVLLSWEGAIKVSDFGVAKALTASDPRASRVIKGKPSYMSPEQANGHPLDGRSDLFSVGVMLWEMLVGQSLFTGASVQETLTALCFAPIPSPRQLRPEVPADLAQVTLRLLQRQREQRYAAAEDAVAELVACHEAPRDGRAELIQLLQARFPSPPSGRPVTDSLGPPSTRTYDPLPTAAATVLHRHRRGAPPEDSSVSIEILRAQPRPWRPLLLGVLGLLAVLGVLGLLGLLGVFAAIADSGPHRARPPSSAVVPARPAASASAPPNPPGKPMTAPTLSPAPIPASTPPQPTSRPAHRSPRPARPASPAPAPDEPGIRDVKLVGPAR